jgi:hypothetical protein
MTREKVKAISHGLTADNTLVIGKEASSMVKEHTLVKIVSRNRENGRMVRKSSGLSSDDTPNFPINDDSRYNNMCYIPLN